MERTSKPDHYSAHVKDLVRKKRAGEITPRTFARIVRLIWMMRHAYPMRGAGDAMG